MASLTNKTKHAQQMHFAANIWRKLIGYISELFSLEEVEVTFTKIGDDTTYSYTKISHKQAV